MSEEVTPVDTFEITAEYFGASSLLDIPAKVADSVIGATNCSGHAVVTFRVHAEDEACAWSEGNRLAVECGRGLGAHTLTVLPLADAVHAAQPAR